MRIMMRKHGGKAPPSSSAGKTSCSHMFVHKHMDPVDLIFRRHCFSTTLEVSDHPH